MAKAGRHRSQISTPLGLSALYVGFGLVMGLIQNGLPTILRAQGASLGSAGALYGLYLPFGVAFLWALLIDRHPAPILTRRIGWIVPMQVLSAMLVAALALLGGAPVAVMVGFGITVAVLMATMDIALDALAVELVEPEWRANAAAAKLAALSTGAVIGGGTSVALFGTLGWHGLFLTVAAGLLLLALPILALLPAERALAASPRPEPVARRASLLHLLRDRIQTRRLLLATLACCVIFPLSGLARMMLVDLGVPPETIGWVVGTLGPLGMLVTALVSAPLARAFGLAGSLFAFAALALVALALLRAGFGLASPLSAIIGAILVGAAVAGLYVAITAAILGWADGPQPATDYAAFYGVGRLAATLAVMGAAQLVGWIGWAAFYGGGALALVLAVALIHRLMSRKV